MKNKVKIENVNKHLKEQLKNPVFKKAYMEERKYLKINILVAKQKAGDPVANTTLLKKFDGLVKRVATKYSKVEPTLSYRDLYQHGVLVFLLLCNKYKVGTGVNFVGYVKKYFEHTFTDLLCEV
jgi:DNA-directed RNA polymerase specialized sigma subunit